MVFPHLICRKIKGFLDFFFIVDSGVIEMLNISRMEICESDQQVVNSELRPSLVSLGWARGNGFYLYDEAS